MNLLEFTALALLSGLSYALLLVILGGWLERVVGWPWSTMVDVDKGRK